MNQQVAQLFASLTLREREILAISIKGYTCKVAARMLDISHLTLQKHRTNIHRKLGSSSLAEIAHLAALAGLNFRR
jgi:DNA-binding CsgD family transcriptional regulator